MNEKEKQKEYTLTAICAAGLEQLVQDEIEGFGCHDISSSTGVVSWKGTLSSAYRACLWSRYSSRILLQLTEFEAKDEDELHSKCMEIPWSLHMGLTTTFAVDCTLSKESAMNHSQYAALRVKDAIVDYFRNREGDRPSVDTAKPGIRVHLHVEKSLATLFLDLSGDSLHRRGYRASGGQAPLKETLAASIVGLCGWPKTENQTLIDPMCGTGTLLIEAALMHGDSAPGLSRSYFGFSGWLQHDDILWQALVDEAVEREERGLEKEWPVIIGYDCDPVVIASARKNIERAGLSDFIQIKQAELATLQPPTAKGMIISNLPYGERLSETEQVSYLYSAFGRICSQRFPGWDVCTFISNPNLTDNFKLAWKSRYKLYNGSIPCRLLIGQIGDEEFPVFKWNKLPERNDDADNEFGNRLRKNLKKYLRWAEKEDVTCFRVYDRDLPEYNISVDLYGKWVHIHEFAPPKTIDSERAATRFKVALKSVKAILGVRSDRVFFKTRQRQKGKKQYQKKNSIKKMYETREGNCHLLVNFTDYLDTGLFLDHRPLRQLISRQAKGKKFLNLFGYTGSATVHAAVAGAASTTTVDLSATYTGWVKLNLALNGMGQKKHTIIQEDCMAWLKECESQYDLIFIDPPTFSNTKKEKRVFDIQKDHFELIKLGMSRLDQSGVLYFSTNFKRFTIDPKLSELFHVRNITKETIPYDYSRNKKIHMCWEIIR